MSGDIHSGAEDVVCTTDNNEFDDEEVKGSDPVTSIIPLCCEICNIKVTSTKILQRHLDGKKHKMRMDRRGKSFKCDLCDVTANSEIQLKIHLNSSKHKAKLLKKEYAEFTDISTSRRAMWILIFCVICIFLNLLLLFKLVL